ncbi:AfsR/SARP family transcriptional regulator [Streptomyces sp. ME19-01-6]|uniref:AfsR/SARP family transcriptional regulator n=1 Tax=Streptomyces sp. ME19-01-6 TaxID=3028686 RepID=UPI0029B210BF|nr:BTAD domain-containing putative transcriptional regulator [Streptomyces sp. ME19-01-6]MDX3232219.1 BTAD domain-containing putative transcriptional regulator [Streptomyces sp. ME19-01-6]
MTYRYRVLGAIQAVRPDGTEVPLGGARLRALLGALAMGGGRPASTAQLAAWVWGEDEAPPADEVAAVQALVGRLRRALGKESVASVPGGYRLVAAPDDIDLFRFERLAAEGSAAIGAGDARLAATLLDEALKLWRGPLLADLPGAAGAASPASRGGPAAVRAERRHAQARRDRLAAEVALGRAEGALAELAALAGQEPLDEPLHALWIRALRTTGRRAEALQAYEEVRFRLVDRLGADPSSELRALHAELLAEDAAPAPPDAWPGGHRGGAWGDVGQRARWGGAERDGARGERWHTEGGTARQAEGGLGQHGAPDGAGQDDWRGGRGGDGGQRGPGNLRPRLTTFVGREAELDALVGELRTRRLVTLMGPGGVGKTRLALEAAEAAAGAGADGAWPGGVWVAELAPVRGGETVAEAVLTALGARDAALRGPGAGELRAGGGAASGSLAELVEHCGRRRMLLVLDNCEHVVDAAAELAQALLTGCPDVTVLTTSREPLGVPGECVRPVEPLPREVALRLLAERGAAVRPGFRAEDDRPACVEICRRLDGLPLAIELAAARLRVLTPRQIADRLDSRFRLLTGGHRTALPRQRTLRAVVDWSWDLLDDGERTVLRRLAVFSGGCALEEAEAVCAGGDWADPVPKDTLDILSSLVDKSLVLAVPEGPGGMRYRLLETVAEYAAQRLAEAGEREAVERRHVTVYRELVRTGDPLLRGPEQPRWLERFEAEHDNVRAALRRAVALREEQEALCLALSMSWFWQLRNHHGDARSWAPAVAALGPDPFLPPVRPAVPLADPCTDQAPPWSEEQLWEARRGMRLMVFAGGGGVGGASADREGAQEYLRGIVDAYRPGLPQTCRQPGFLWFSARLLTGQAASLGESLDAMVRDCRELGHVWELGFALLLRARLRYDHPGGPERSAGDADQALTRFERAGDPWGIAESLSARGEAHEWRNRYEEAAADFARAIKISARGGAQPQVPALKAKLASVRLETARDAGEEAAAERLLRQAVAESGRCAGETLDTARLILVQRLGRTGRTGAARDQLDQLEQAFPAATPAFLTGMVAGLHGWLDCLDGAYERAQGHLRRAVRSLETLAYLIAPHLIAEQFISAAWAKAHLGAAEDGARLLGAYDHGPVMEGFCFRSFSAAAEVRQRAEAELRRALDARTYERAYAEGGGLEVKEAAALV